MELFGNEADEFGAGHFQSKRGKFETADGGTIYLENIESMPMPVQAKFLRYLTEGEFETEGIGKVVKAGVRVIVGATNGLEQLVEQKKILPELYQELNIIHIALPELKNRKEDIPILIKHFIKKYSKENHKKISDISPEVLDKFMNYQWPGNVRELENCIKRMIVMSNSKILDESLLPNSIRNIIEEEKQYEGSVEAVIDGILKDKLERIVSFFSTRRRKKSAIYKRITGNIDKILIELSLKKCNNVQTDAAAFLGINRNTLRAKIEKLKIDNNYPKETKAAKRKHKKNLDLPFK
jgi:Nif-specific regulatory protein